MSTGTDNARLVTAHRQREGGGFIVRRPFPSGDCRAGIKQATETRNAAALQIQAIAQQTAALEQQNADLKRAERRRLAQESLVGARMLDASLEVVATDHETDRRRDSRNSPFAEPFKIVFPRRDTTLSYCPSA